MQHFYQNVLRALLGLTLFTATGVLLFGGGAMAPVSADLKILAFPMLILTVGFGLRHFVQPLFRQLLRPLRQVYPAGTAHTWVMGFAYAISLFLILPAVASAQAPTCSCNE